MKRALASMGVSTKRHKEPVTTKGAPFTCNLPMPSFPVTCTRQGYTMRAQAYALADPRPEG